jgi:hypothetical protein
MSPTTCLAFHNCIKWLHLSQQPHFHKSISQASYAISISNNHKLLEFINLPKKLTKQLMRIALQYIWIMTFSISTKSLIQITSYNHPFSKIWVPKIQCYLKNLLVKLLLVICYCSYIAIVSYGALQVVVCMKKSCKWWRQRWWKPYYWGREIGNLGFRDGDVVTMLPLDINCFRQNFSNGGPFFPMALLQALFWCRLLTNFH